MKGKLLLVLVCLSVLLSSVPAYAGGTLGSVDYWYSDSSKIGSLPTTTKVYLTKDSSFAMADSDYLNMCSNALSAWSGLNISYTNGTTSNYNLLIQGIDRPTANSLGVPSNYSSSTGWITTTKLGTVDYQGIDKDVYSLSKVITYHVWDSSTSGIGLPHWTAIATHEQGHAVGYAGHDLSASSSNKSLLHPESSIYFSTWGISTPQTRDLNHLDAMY